MNADLQAIAKVLGVVTDDTTRHQATFPFGRALKRISGSRRVRRTRRGSGIPGPRGGTMGALLPFAKVIRMNKRPMRVGVWA